MSQFQTSLVLTGDGSDLAQAVAVSEKALDGLQDATRQTGQTMKSARESAAVFETALDKQRASVTQLATGFDAAARSARVFDAQQSELKRALDLGAIDANEYDAALSILTQQHRQAAAAAELQANATGRLTRATAGGAGGIQNFSYQLQDIFTQVGMGVPLMISLGQQAPQILSGFGQIGAILGVVAAGAFPLAAAIFGLGYQTRQTADKVKTSADLINEALSTIGDAQSTLRTNSLTNLDAIADKYGTFTASVLTLMQAQNELATQDALRATQTGLAAVFGGDAFASVEALAADRAAIITELRRELNAAQARLPVAVDRAQAQREIDQLVADLEAYAASEDLALDLGIDQAGLQDVLIFQNAIEDALAAENYQGALTVINQMRDQLQSIPDGPLREMYAGVVSAEGALREAITAAERNKEVHDRISNVLTEISGVDVGAGIRVATEHAKELASALGAALTNASSLATQGANALEDAEINFRFRNNPVERARALAGARFDRRANTNGIAVPDGAARDLAAQREAYINDAGRAAGLNDAARGASGLARDHKRAVQSIERDLARLAPSYARDSAAIQRWRDETLAALDPTRAGYEMFARDVEQIYEARLAEAYQRDLDRREDWAAGVERGLNDVAGEMRSFADVSQDLVTGWSSGLEDAFVNLNRTGRLQIGDLVDFTLDAFARMAFQQTIMPGLSAGFNVLTNALGGIFTQSHAGSTIGTGGVRRSYGPGAPLRADERLTVTTMGQRVFTPEQISNGATVVDALAMAARANTSSASVVFAPNISIVNQSSAQVSGTMTEQPSSTGERNYQLVLADEVGAALSRKGGGANRTLERGYGLRKPGVPR